MNWFYHTIQKTQKKFCVFWLHNTSYKHKQLYTLFVQKYNSINN